MHRLWNRLGLDTAKITKPRILLHLITEMTQHEHLRRRPPRRDAVPPDRCDAHIGSRRPSSGLFPAHPPGGSWNKHEELFGVLYNSTKGFVRTAFFACRGDVFGARRPLFPLFTISKHQNLPTNNMEPRPSLTWSGGKDAAQYKSTLKEEE